MARLIQVCGDPTVDWLRVHNEDVVVRGGVYFWQKQKETSRVRLSSKPGGAAMVLDLLQEMIDDEAKVEGTILEDELLSRPKDYRITTSWTMWKEFVNPGFGRNAYRLGEWQEFEPGYWDYSLGRLFGTPDLLVIWDSGLGFRSTSEGWPEILKTTGGTQPGHIIIKLGQYNDGQNNPLLNRITELGLNDRTTIISSLSDLRSCAVKVGVSLSWERMLEEVVAAVLSPNCPFVDENGLIKYKQVVIPVSMSGAIIVGREENTLIFDRSGQEGDFSARFPGQMIGDNCCIVAALAASWAQEQEEVDWAEAALLGVELARLLHIIGYKVVEADGYKYLEFPYAAIAKVYRGLKKGEMPLEHFLYQGQIGDLGVFRDKNHLAVHHPGNWTILESNLLNEQEEESLGRHRHSVKAVNEIARDIVVRGPQAALLNIPVETIGAWCSADRQEIEGVRGVNNAMWDYLQLKNPQTPLSVAVFGPPGAGKSFVIKEIARGLGINEEAQLTFNLSQFESPAELRTAFHLISDLNLKGRMPLVFWDEFDTPCEGQPLGWLRYFLAPMQDGEFTHQGISHSYEEFRSGNDQEDRAAKKPDFISRLRAYINIRSINGSPNTVEDRLYMVRRAFILRHYLETNAPQIKHNEHLEIEPGVLDAFLLVTKYKHGTRSMENLLKMSSLADKRKYELSSLPPDHIIEMNVNLKEFKDLTRLGHREMLKIGILGHTKLDPQQIEELRKAVERAIDFIEQEFPDHYLTVLSPLADGAERMVAQEFMRRDTHLIPVLPVPLEEYLNDFGSTDDFRLDPPGAELRREFRYWLSECAIDLIEMPMTPTRRAAYVQAGCFIAEHSDVILAVWDGEHSGEGTITAQILTGAENLYKPICHIWAANFKPELPSTLAEEKSGMIRYRRFPSQTPNIWTEL